jgi:hypothetical protein
VSNVEFGRPAVDEVPLRHQLSADPAADRGPHLGEFDIEPGDFDGCPRCLNGFLGLAPISGARVEFLLRDGTELGQLLRPRQILLGALVPGPGLFRCGLGAIQFCLIRPWVNDEE